MTYIKFLVMLLVLSACGSNFEKTPVDSMIQRLSDEASTFSIILDDMDVRGTFFKDYYHQYRVVKTVDSEPKEETTGWMEVSDSFFQRHQENLGMELAAKTEDGEIVKTPAPPGYSSYIGNQRYGNWVNRNGNSFWEFYGQYAFMSSMFNLMTFPVRRSYYGNYMDDYRGRRPYYGPTTSGRRMYGTGSTYTSRVKPNSTWSRNPSSSSFKQRVQRSVSQSSRSGSRYSSSGSFRSRGGGFGK